MYNNYFKAEHIPMWTRFISSMAITSNRKWMYLLDVTLLKITWVGEGCRITLNVRLSSQWSTVVVQNHKNTSTMNISLQTNHFCCCLFGGFVPLESFLLIWRRHYYQWRATNFDLQSELMAIKQLGFFKVPHHDTGQPFIIIISEHPLHSHLLPKVCQRSCH